MTSFGWGNLDERKWLMWMEIRRNDATGIGYRKRFAMRPVRLRAVSPVVLVVVTLQLVLVRYSCTICTVTS